jgi:hypothetical protein
MAVPSSGQLRLNADINLEINGTGTGTDVSLNGLSASAGFTAPNGMEEFYGYVDAVAPSVTSSSAISITSSSMTARGNVTSDGGGTITERGFYFGTSTTATNNTKYTVSGTTGSFTRNFTGLSSSTTYRYFPFATNSAGTTIGSMITVTTSQPTVASLFSSLGSRISNAAPSSGTNNCGYSEGSTFARWGRNSMNKTGSTTVSASIFIPGQTSNGVGGYNLTGTGSKSFSISGVIYFSSPGCNGTRTVNGRLSASGYSTYNDHYATLTCVC